MPVTFVSILLMLVILPAAQVRPIIMPVETSDAIDLARMIARDEGYNVSNTKIYSFEQLTGSEGTAFLQGYTAIGFFINGSARNLFVINNATGQVLDYNTCEIFEYPNLVRFQKERLRLSNAKLRTALGLASDAGCSTPKLLTKPRP